MKNTKIQALISNSCNPTHARQRYFELLDEKHGLENLKNEYKKARCEFLNHTKRYVKAGFFVTQEDFIKLSQFNKKIPDDMLLNPLGILLKATVDNKIQSQKFFKEKLDEQTNGIYVGQLQSTSYNARILLSNNNEHLVLLHTGLMSSCYLMSHLAVANLGFETDDESKKVTLKHNIGEEPLLHHAFSFFRKMNRYGTKHDFSVLKLAPIQTDVMMDITSYAEEFIVLHEYSHVLNGDFNEEGNSIIESQQLDKLLNVEKNMKRELLADMVASILVVTPYITNSPITPNNHYELSARIAGIYISLLCNHVVVSGSIDESLSYYVDPLQRWDLIKNALLGKLGKSLFTLQEAIEHNLEKVIKKCISLLKSHATTANLIKEVFNDEEQKKIDNLLLTLTSIQIEMLNSLALSHPGGYNKGLIHELMLILTILNNEGDALNDAVKIVASGDIKRSTFILNILGTLDAEKWYTNYELGTGQANRGAPKSALNNFNRQIIFYLIIQLLLQEKLLHIKIYMIMNKLNCISLRH